MIGKNPFLSTTYKTIWLKHFDANKNGAKHFDFVNELEFVKHPKLPFYLNIGKTHTKGISYSINSELTSGIKNSTFMIYDVPTYFNIDTQNEDNKLGFYKSKQYPGFLIETSRFESLNDYMLANFSKNSRNKNNKYKRRLESSFNINYKMFYGDVSKEEYLAVFKAFKELLEKRFEDKQTTNNNLDTEEWDFYEEVVYPLILEKKATLFVIYDNTEIIGVTLCYLSEDILFDAITVFDIDYFKFHLGSVTIMKLIEWCIENKIKKFDFSKGYFDYKTRWCTDTYDFEYHIYFDAKSFKSRMLASSLKRLYDIKQSLREKNINEKLHKLTYRLKNKGATITDKVNYVFTEIGDDTIDANKSVVNTELKENKLLKLLIFEFLYLYNEQSNKVKLYELMDSENYLVEGDNKSMFARIEINKNTN